MEGGGGGEETPFSQHVLSLSGKRRNSDGRPIVKVPYTHVCAAAHLGKPSFQEHLVAPGWHCLKSYAENDVESDPPPREGVLWRDHLSASISFHSVPSVCQPTYGGLRRKCPYTPSCETRCGETVFLLISCCTKRELSDNCAGPAR